MSNQLYDSSIKAWISFRDGFTVKPELPALENCTINGTITNCTYICSDEDSLFDPFTPANLVTCGLWQTVSTAISSGDLDNSSKYTAPFEDLGLSITNSGVFNINDISLSDEVSASMLECFGTLCYYRYHDNTMCDKCWDALFGSPIDCLNTICSPQGSLNPDIGGIGVSVHSSVPYH